MLLFQFFEKFQIVGLADRSHPILRLLVLLIIVAISKVVQLVRFPPYSTQPPSAINGALAFLSEPPLNQTLIMVKIVFRDIL